MINLKMKDINLKFNTLRCSRGIRNNNPGNIRRNDIKWLGMSTKQTDSSFVQFDKMEYGVRALLLVLRSYYLTHNLHTVKDIITRYAPCNENNTEKYITYVCSYVALSPDVKFSLSCCLSLALPIMRFESGFRMTLGELHKIIDKYNLCKSDIF